MPSAAVRGIMADLLRTPLHALHVAAGAQMVPFAGYDMPVRFTSIQQEHEAVRTAVGLFDVSHMGNLWFRGPEAAQALSKVTTADATAMKDGGTKYTSFLREDATIIDDTYLFRTPQGFHVVPNAGMHGQVVEWIRKHTQANIDDVSDTTCILALQGPKAKDVLQKLVTADLATLKPFRCAMLSVAGSPPVLVSRTGYTGEDGFEVMPPAAWGEKMWRAMMEAGKPSGIQPVGLGARDTLRLEKGYCLAGHEFAGGRTPLEASMDRFIHWDHDFVGKEALQKQRARGGYEKLVGLVLEGRAIPRQDCVVQSPDGTQLWGKITSGTLSPTLKKGVALAYVKPEHAAPGTEVRVLVRDTPAQARVQEPPFVK